ncbi:lipoate--protein ligase family protein [Paenibacillus senegalensis]|uniref:lipoate--protein ligase family protein n=1 Tax=Paenibacillus senegalensis TaxID=1465766 RepID=UPI0002897604|nr:lipoate--protein ligase family protein [Paenibacillus senegalensis]
MKQHGHNNQHNEASLEAGGMEAIRLVVSDYDHDPFPAIMPFAWDEVMCAQARPGDRPILHVWRHPSAFIIGLRDRRLPKVTEALQWLRNEGRETVVRNSGGAAVPLDSGVINLSLIFPKPSGRINFHRDFAAMVSLIRETLRGWTDQVQDGEIAGSYCPGDYDLSINGKKFCGIAQRRQANGVVIQAFINVDGQGASRARLAKTFYERAAGGESGQFPRVTLEHTASLQELIPISTADEYIQAVRSWARLQGGQELLRSEARMTSPEVENAMRALIERYDK